MKHSVVILFVVVVMAGAAPVKAHEGAPDQNAEPSGSGSAADQSKSHALTALLASYAALQALDISSTYRTRAVGEWEANPVVRQALQSPAALIAMKAGSAALTIAMANRLSRQHPRAAILMMIGINSAYTAIVAHNYTVAR